jgi:signal transduction histidine kinase
MDETFREYYKEREVEISNYHYDQVYAELVAVENNLDSLISSTLVKDIKDYYFYDLKDDYVNSLEKLNENLHEYKKIFKNVILASVNEGDCKKEIIVDDKAIRFCRNLVHDKKISISLDLNKIVNSKKTNGRVKIVAIHKSHDSSALFNRKLLKNLVFVYEKDQYGMALSDNSLIYQLIFSFFIVLFFVLTVLWFLWKDFISFFYIVTQTLSVKKIEDLRLVSISNKDSRFLYTLKSKFNDFVDKIIKSKQLENEVAEIELKTNINRQIAHDIRSPLEALKSIANNLDSLDYNTKRIVTNSIGRISDIANGLLKTGKEEQKEFMPGSLGILIDDIISDKSFERDATINYELKVTYKDTYMLGNENQLYRAISNIINNGIEAQDNDAKIDIELDNLNGELILSVKDYGKGMDEQTAIKVLDGGYTTKEKGNGLGLSYAKKVIEEHDGNLVLNSNLGKGTEIKISLPSIKAPKWLVDELKVEESAQKIVCVDDDPSFLELYKDKFKEVGVEVITFTEKEIEKTLNVENAQYYFDYDLGKEDSGLDFIIENGLANFSTLVTSMHQDEDIQKRCIENGIKILPKQMFNKASVEVVKICRETEVTKQYILIDDDELMHMTWKMEANKKAIEFKAYSSVEEFIKDADQYSKNTVIYVDSNLADGLKGEIESEKISQLGFTEIYLATGFSADDLEKPEWIREIVGKRPDFK